MRKAALFIFTISILFVSSISLNAQVMDICKVMEVEQFHAAKKFNHKSAPQTARYNVTYYRLDLELDPAVHFVQGNVTTHFTTLDSNFSSVVFDFDNSLFVDSVIYQGQSINFSTAGFHTVEAFLPVTHGIGVNDSVTIHYKGTPRGGSSNPPFARVNIPNGNLIWTLSEPYGAQQWWPCKNDLTDKADSIEIIVTTPQINRVASNGLLLSIDSLNNFATYHWKTTYPTVAYLVAVGVGRYDFYQEKYALGTDSLLMNHYLFANQTQAQSSNGVLPFLQLFDSLFGEYPFIEEKYGHASFTVNGGMEHQTMSFMGNYGGELKAHELAHQWFGNKITCGSWSDLWLNEGFATYLTGLTYNFGVVHPTSLWPTWLRLTENAGLQFPNGSVYRYGNDTLFVNSLFNNQVYAKGAITLHTLRWKMGDSAFFAGVKNYITDTSLAYGFAKTPHLKSHLEAVYGQSLTEFFNDWVYGAGFPNYNTYWSQSGSTFLLNVQQQPSDPSVSFFDIPVPYRLSGPALDTIIVVEPTTNNQSFSIPISKVVDSVEFDPNNNIFAREVITTGLNQLSANKNAINVFPNPTESLLKIETLPGLQINRISVYDFQGRLINRYGNKEVIDVSFLNAGMYLLVIDTPYGILNKKFQKVN